MARDDRPDAVDDSEGVEDLVRERERLLEWIEKLEAHAERTPPHVYERVRDDYLARLHRVTEQVAQHRSALREEFTARNGLLRDADERLGALRDELAETRLRQGVGELRAEEAERRCEGLERAIDDALLQRDELQESVRRISALLEGLGDETPESAAAPPRPAQRSAPSSAPREDAAVEEDVTLEGDWETELGFRGFAGYTEDTDDVTLSGGADLAFLEELDRAIAASSDPTASLDELRADEESSVPPPPGRKCPECGYKNPVEARKCEMCDTGLP